MKHGSIFKGSVVLISFPFSDLSKSKLRPAVILATSQRYSDLKAIELSNRNFQSGSLRKTSFVRTGKLFTANDSLIVSNIGKLDSKIFDLIIETRC